MTSGEDFKAAIEGLIGDYPICEYAFLKPEELVYSDKVRFICETTCPRYGKSWACPPVIPSVETCMDAFKAYEHVFLFSTVAEVSDSMNNDICLVAKRDHEKVTLDLRRAFRDRFGEVLALSTGCRICDDCTYPDGPCRFPDERLSSVESHGVLIMETASSLGISYDCGNNIVTYFSLIFFNTEAS
ncbi:DUF2284 domain-containing protein [Oscillospiraceae bacterium CM]|nr:DUF2284 domain-containing protein [Oscillospiraceae bacterium CM]